MSNETSNLLNFLLPLLVAILGFIVNRWGNQNQIKKLKLDQKALEQKLDLDKEAAEQAKHKNDADLSKQFLDIATESGQQVISRDATIKELQTAMGIMRKQVDELIADKRKLENENTRKDERITALETDNARKDERITALETDKQVLLDRIEALETEVKHVNKQHGGDCDGTTT